MELEELIERIEMLATAMSGEKGKILAYVFKNGERTYDQLTLFIENENELKKSLINQFHFHFLIAVAVDYTFRRATGIRTENFEVELIA